ncbi:MAG: ZIP family metal transporter [Acidimicrobiia bacterium]
MNLPAGVVWLRQRVARGEGPTDLEEPVGSGAESAVVAEPAARAGWWWVVGLVVAVAATLGALVLMRSTGLDGLLRPQPAAIPEITFERVTLGPEMVTAKVRNTGPEAIEVSQVLVDEAYRVFTVNPGPRLERLDSAQVRIPYPWVAGEPLSIALVDSTGTTHVHEIEAAAITPTTGGRTVLGYVVLGTYVGVIPVFLGLLFLPALARLGRRGLRFLLGVTAGLLIFLGVDALGESLELAGELASVMQGPALVFAGAAGTYGALAYMSRGRRGKGAAQRNASPLSLAYLIAVGIGLHNFGEGLAIGSAHARGEVALGTALVVGFALHNITEGIGIASPTMFRLPSWRHLLALGAVAGLPTITGTLIGGFAYSDILGALFLAIGVGAIAEVVDELARYARRRADAPGALLGGAAAGFVLMYATALMIGA